MSQIRQYLHVQQILGLKESSCKIWGHFCTASVHNISKKKQQRLFYKMDNEAIFIVLYKFYVYLMLTALNVVIYVLTNSISTIIEYKDINVYTQ